MRIQLEIFLGLLFASITAGILLIAGFNEESRMAAWTQESKAKSIEAGADLYGQACAACHGPQGKGVPGLAPPLNDRHFFTDRLNEVGWTGDRHDYIVSTVSAGRMASTRPDQYVGNGSPAMPSWAEEYGGPFRKDQIENLAAYILNWEEEAMAAPAVTQTVVGFGTDITKPLVEGDVARGESLANTLGCAACHITTVAGPAWLPSAAQAGIGARAETRLTEANYAGAATDATQYLVEAIVGPNAYVVEGFQPNVMPQTYGNSITDQQIADMVAYLLSLK